MNGRDRDSLEGKRPPGWMLQIWPMDSGWTEVMDVQSYRVRASGCKLTLLNHIGKSNCSPYWVVCQFVTSEYCV